MTLPFLHHQKWGSSPKSLLDSNLLQRRFLLWSLLCDLGRVSLTPYWGQSSASSRLLKGQRVDG